MSLQLEFSGSHEINATRELVWGRLMDPHFMTKSVPGVESVQPVGPGKFQVGSGLNLGLMKLNVTIDIELSDLVEPERGKVRASASAAGSTIDVVSAIQLEDVGAGRTLLRWAATTVIGGSLAGLGSGMVEAVARRLTTDFWADFARRAAAES